MGSDAPLSISSVWDGVAGGASLRQWSSLKVNNGTRLLAAPRIGHTVHLARMERPMVPNLYATLTPDEFASLREVSKGHTQRIIPDAHKAKLLYLGLIRQKLGGLVQTNIGYLHVAKRQSG